MATLREISLALREATAAGDRDAVRRLSTLLEHRTIERRDELLARLEALCDQLDEAGRRGDAEVAESLFPRLQRALTEYERLADSIRAHPLLPDSLTIAGVWYGKKRRAR